MLDNTGIFDWLFFHNHNKASKKFDEYQKEIDAIQAEITELEKEPYFEIIVPTEDERRKNILNKTSILFGG